MKKQISLIVVVLFMVGLVGCSGVQVTTTQTVEKKIVKLAKVAAVLFAANNKEEVAAVLPYVKTALGAAKNGKLGQGDIMNLITDLSSVTGNEDVKTALSLLAVEVSGIEITADGTPNAEVVEALEAIVAGLEAGAA